jgi:hypothetical protein
MADDNSQNLQIHIVSDADIKGFTQASAAGQKLRVETSDLSDETKRQLGILPQLEDNLKKGGAAAEGAGMSHRELRRTLMDIGNVAAPGAGRAMSELALGPVGAALALVGLYEMLKKKLEEDEAEMDKMADAAAKPIGGGVESLQKAWDNASASLGGYFAKLSTAGRDNDPLATQIKHIKELADAQTEASKKIVEALGQQTIARLREAGAGKEQLEAAETNTKRQIAALDQQKEHATGSQALEFEKKQRDADSEKLKATAVSATQEAFRQKRLFDDQQKQLEQAREKLDPNSEGGKALNKRSDEAQAKLEKADAMPTAVADPAGSGDAIDVSAARNDAIREAQDELKKAQGERATYKKQKDELEKTEVARNQAFEKSQEEARARQQASETNEKRRGELPGEIKEAHAVETTADRGSQVVDVLNTHGGKTNAALGEVASAIGMNEQTKLRIVDAILKHQLTVKQEWAYLDSRVAQLEAQGKHITFNSR